MNSEQQAHFGYVPIQPQEPESPHPRSRRSLTEFKYMFLIINGGRRSVAAGPWPHDNSPIIHQASNISTPARTFLVKYEVSLHMYI